MDKLITLQEVQALVALFSKCTMSPAEILWANMLANRLFAYAQPPRPKPPAPDGKGDPSDVDLDTVQPGPDAA